MAKVSIPILVTLELDCSVNLCNGELNYNITYNEIQ